MKTEDIKNLDNINDLNKYIVFTKKKRIICCLYSFYMVSTTVFILYLSYGKPFAENTNRICIIVFGLIFLFSINRMKNFLFDNK